MKLSPRLHFSFNAVTHGVLTVLWVRFIYDSLTQFQSPVLATAFAIAAIGGTGLTIKNARKAWDASGPAPTQP